MGIEETRYGICLQCNKSSYLDIKLLLPGGLDGMLYELDMQDPQKSDCWTFQKTDGPSRFLLHRSNGQKQLMNFTSKAEQGLKCPASLKSLPDIWAYGLKMSAPTL